MRGKIRELSGLVLAMLVLTPTAFAQTVGPEARERLLERVEERRVRVAERTLEVTLARPLRSGTVSSSYQDVPPPGVYDLSIDGDVDLGGAVFQGGLALLHTDGGTAFGQGALDEISTGDFNTAIGFRALTSTTTGLDNTAVGDYAGELNLDGNANTAIGQYALQFNESSGGNTAVGRGALRNTVGYYLIGITLGSNTGVGYLALAGNSTGFYNTTVGSYASLSIYDGYSNTAVGTFAFDAATSASSNTAVGYDSLGNVRTGEFNTAVGSGSGNSLTSADSSNVLLNSGGLSGDDNTLRIGQASGTGNRELNAAYIHGIFSRSVDDGSDMPVVIDNTGKLGTLVSSRRYKEDVRDLGERSERLLELRPVSFRYKRERADEASLRYGLIAEEVAEIYPELVVFDERGRPDTVKYHLLSAMLLSELQRQHGQIAELRRRLEAVESR